MRLLIVLLGLLFFSVPGFAQSYDVTTYGATPNGGSDDTAAIQAAIDDCQSHVSGSAGAGEVFFPAGRYDFSNTLIWKSCHWAGIFPNNGVRLQWDGPSTITAVAKTQAFVGGISFASMEGINFRDDGGPGPLHWIQAVGADILFNIENVHFGPASGSSLYFTSWSNLYLRKVRFDGGLYAIELETANSQNLSTASIKETTWDSTPGGVSNGFMRIHNDANVSAVGIVAIESARLEVNQQLDGNRGIIEITKTCSASCNAATVQLSLENVTYDDAAGNAADSLVFLDVIGPTPSREDVRLRNVRTGALANLFGGDWAQPYVTGIKNGINNIPLLVLYGPDQTKFVGASIQAWNSAVGDKVLDSRAAPAGVLDVQDRYRILADGDMEWGDGIALPDTRLERQGANTLGLAPGDVFRITPTDTPGVCNAGRRGALYFDGSVGNLCSCNGSVWRQASGAGC